MSEWYEKMKSVKVDDVLLYNQGDAFFADNGIDIEIGAKLDEPVKPVIEEMFGPRNKTTKGNE